MTPTSDTRTLVVTVYVKELGFISCSNGFQAREPLWSSRGLAFVALPSDRSGPRLFSVLFDITTVANSTTLWVVVRVYELPAMCAIAKAVAKKDTKHTYEQKESASLVNFYKNLDYYTCIIVGFVIKLDKRNYQYHENSIRYHNNRPSSVHAETILTAKVIDI